MIGKVITTDDENGVVEKIYNSKGKLVLEKQRDCTYWYNKFGKTLRLEWNDGFCNYKYDKAGIILFKEIVASDGTYIKTIYDYTKRRIIRETEDGSDYLLMRENVSE